MQFDLVDAAFAMPEVLAPVWIEFCMFGLAMACYTVFAGTIPYVSQKGKGLGRPTLKSDIGRKSMVADEDVQQLLTAARCGRIGKMLEHFERLPRASAMQCCSHVLSALAKTPLDDPITEKLMTLDGMFDSKGLELAAQELQRQSNLQACQRLYQIAGLASITKTRRALELMVSGLSADPVAMRALVDEIAVEKNSFSPSRSLLTSLYAMCDSKDPAHAARKDRSRVNRDAQSMAEAIMAHGKEGRLDKAVEIVEGLKSCDGGMCTLLYNCLLDACIQCNDVTAAIGYFDEMKQAGLVDVVSFNTMIKGRLVQGGLDQAQELLQEMLASGLSATCITYHMMLNAYVQRGDRCGSWKVVEQMRSAGHRPNAVTCSILLKAVVSTAQIPDLQRIVKLADEIDQASDEVLFVSLVEASIRARSLGLLSEKMRDFAAQGKLAKLSSPTYGSMIKAYGQVKDIHRVRELWDEMLAQQVIPTPITVGCMIEALVMSGCTQEAWDLTQKLWEDESQRSSVNTVIYSTILKGFAMTRQHTKVTALYEEMKQRNIPRNTITFNTILNSIARCGLMDRVPEILADMRNSEPQAVPDLVTYSTIIKGYCQSGNVDKALELLQQMVTEAQFKPDEVMYNSLLDGCAREQRLEEALRLLAEMRKEKVAPSNYTLSILCKLLGRARRLAQAFDIVDSISKDYGFQPNIQVYTCLIQACFHNRQVGKALGLHDEIVRKGIDPDEKTYTVLASGCLQAGSVEKAAMVVRCAFHLPCAMQRTKDPKGLEAKCLKDVMSQLKRTNAGAAQALDAELQARPQQHRGASAWGPSQRGTSRKGA